MRTPSYDLSAAKQSVSLRSQLRCSPVGSIVQRGHVGEYPACPLLRLSGQAGWTFPGVVGEFGHYGHGVGRRW
jgi:hypothetical protein